MSPRNFLAVLAASTLSLPILRAAESAPIQLTVDSSAAGTPISPDLIGIFFEDLNYAADGGLYAELVQNRSFEYRATEQPSWGPLTSWEFVRRGGGTGDLWADDTYPLHPNNLHCALVQITDAGEGVGLSNAGFDGIPVTAGDAYDFSIFVRMIHVGSRRDSKPIGTLPLSVRLETGDGAVLAEAHLQASAPAEWTQLTATLTASQTVPDARLVVLVKSPGLIALDEVSLFPRKTFKGRKNGLRADLAQVIADLHPKFVRFPGGCLVHGDGVGNIYRWKDTVGPVEQRKGQANIWRYHQTVGLGYFEYFQFCEDIGAKPMPVVAAGVSCQNSSRAHGTGQQCIPMSDMPVYAQEVLDLIEWANGPADSPWGAKRAAAGHPAPFGLKYLGVGNEDKITPEFKERFRMIYEAVKKAHPEIVVIGTVGPNSDGEDFDKGWDFATELRLPIVDEHYYKSPEWFWENLRRYDTYDRTKSKVYVGEYAAHDPATPNTLRSALAEAAYLTSLERNGDVVHFASYAPLLARRNRTQWKTDLIYFTGTAVYPSINYEIQRLVSLNSGDVALPVSLAGAQARHRLAISSVRDSASGDVILKIVNGEDRAMSAVINLGATSGDRDLTGSVLTAERPDIANVDGERPAALPVVDRSRVGPTFSRTFPAQSFTVLRLRR
jgi:alpha-N-arabinofuranosidase